MNVTKAITFLQDRCRATDHAIWMGGNRYFGAGFLVTGNRDMDAEIIDVQNELSYHGVMYEIKKRRTPTERCFMVVIDTQGGNNNEN